MNLSRFLWISLLVSFAATIVLGALFGGQAFALFLLLPLGFLFKHRRPPDSGRGSDSRPIEPE